MLRRIQVARGETVTAAGTAEELLKKLRQNIRETIQQNGELASPEAFVGCVVLRFETEDGEPTTIEFLVPRGCGGKIVEREIRKIPQADYRTSGLSGKCSTEQRPSPPGPLRSSVGLANL